MGSFEPTDEQRAVIDNRRSHVLVFAGPGTGKTETLARRFASLVHDDAIGAGSILVLTFSRRAADGMRQRVVQRLRERSGGSIAVPELHVYTFHGFCSRLIQGDRPRGGQRELLTPVKERLIWNRVTADLKLKTFADDVVRSDSFAAAALNFIARLKGDGITPERFASEAGTDERLRDLARLYRLMDEQRRRLGLSDFRDLVADAVAQLADAGSDASAWLGKHETIRHVLVDEFQDSDPMQLKLLEALGKDALFADPPVPEMCFVGDFNQSIYRFRGAEPANIEKAKERFKCRELTLSLNRRSVQAVLDVANRTPRMRPESLTSAEAGNTRTGSVRLVQVETCDDEIAAVADTVAERVRSGTPPEKIAVLLRVVEPYRGAIARELQARGVPVSAQSTAGLLEDSLIDAVLSCMRVLAGQSDGAAWKRLLNNPIVGFRPLSVSHALRADPRLENHPRRALDAFPPAGRSAWPDFAERLDRCRQIRGNDHRFDPAALIEAIVRELDLLWPIREDRDMPGFDFSASPARLAALIQAAHDIKQTSAHLGGERLSPSTFLRTLDDVMGLLGDPYEGPQAGVDGVPVMSIHAAKGLEFDAVVIPQLIDGVLPARPRPDPLFGGRRLPFVRNLDDAILEEASLWYVALTRARFDVLATASRLGDEADEQPLSPFAHLIDDVKPAGAATPGRLEPAGFAAAYAASTDDQRRAGPVARYIAERPVLHAYVQAGGLVAQPARPLRWNLDRLSPSGIEKYVECPRHWFYQYAMQLTEDDEDVTRMGRFVHSVLERYHRRVSDFSNAASALKAEDILRELTPLADEEARRTATESGLSTDSSIYRYELARIMRQLRAYAEWLVAEARARPFTIVACEQRVEIPLRDIKLVGRVDRVDRLADGSLVVRDYKSGAMHWKPCSVVVADALDQIDETVPGIGLFGDAPKGLKLQTFLYVRGVESMFGSRVVRAEYLYLAGRKD